MAYDVLIRKVATGEERLCRQDLQWGESSVFWWTEGNMGCDCNRHLEFERAGGREPDDGEVECDGALYTAVKAILKDGTEVRLDPPRGPAAVEAVRLALCAARGVDPADRASDDRLARLAVAAVGIASWNADTVAHEMCRADGDDHYLTLKARKPEAEAALAALAAL